jgi:hypothetical protein
MAELDQRNKEHPKAHDLGEFVHVESGNAHRWQLAREDSSSQPSRNRLVWIVLSNQGLEAAVGNYYAGSRFRLSLDQVLRGDRKEEFEYYFGAAVYQNLLEVAAAMKGRELGS